MTEPISDDEEPDALGRFTAAGVARLCASRDCTLVAVDEQKIGAVIRANEAPPNAEPQYAEWADEGWWLPGPVYAACTLAKNLKVPSWDPPRELDLTSYGLREDYIARLLSSDGIRPFYAGARSVALGALVRTAKFEEGRLAHGDRKIVKAAVRAVTDARIATVTFGKRGGWACAFLNWHDRAKLTKMTPEERAVERAYRIEVDEFLDENARRHR
jgi:hypothetical protein